MALGWQPTVAEVTPHLRRWLEGGATDEQTEALEGFVVEAAADVKAEVGISIPPQHHDMARVAGRYLAAYRYVRAWHPEVDDLLRERYHEDYVEALARLQRAMSATPGTARSSFGSIRAMGPARRAAESLDIDYSL